MVDGDEGVGVAGVVSHRGLVELAALRGAEAAVKRYDSVAEFLREWVHIRPVTFFEINCCVRKNRQSCQREIKGLLKRRVLEVEPHRFGRREIPTYKFKRVVSLEDVRLSVKLQK